MNETNGKEYISITLELRSAIISSTQIRNNQAAISLLAVEPGFLVSTSIKAKNDCDTPIYNMGSILTIGNVEINNSKIAKRS